MNGTELLDRRRALGLSQEHVAYLAALTGKHRRMTISHWENGDPISHAFATLLDLEFGRLEALAPDALARELAALSKLDGRRRQETTGSTNQ